MLPILILFVSRGVNGGCSIVGVISFAVHGWLGHDDDDDPPGATGLGFLI